MNDRMARLQKGTKRAQLDWTGLDYLEPEGIWLHLSNSWATHTKQISWEPSTMWSISCYKVDWNGDLDRWTSCKSWQAEDTEICIAKYYYDLIVWNIKNNVKKIIKKYINEISLF